MAASFVALRCRRPFFFNNNNNAAAAAGLVLGKDSSSNQLKKRQLLPLRKRKSQIKLRSSSSPSAITIPMESATTTTTTSDRLSVYSSLLAADQDVDCNYQLDEGIFKMTMGMEPTTSSSNKHKEEEEPPIVSIVANMLDKWMRDSVSEIVRNIDEAPFLVHIYSSSNEIEGDDGDDDAIIDHASSTSSAKTTTTTTRRSEKTRFEREAAVSDDWPRISRRWKQNSSCKPDGIILVEQLKGQEEEEEAAEEQPMECCSSSSRQCRQCSKSKTWGIVIQGRELDCPACYILKTTRVCSSVGFCTHFCLIKAKCFGDPAELQLRDCWLQRQ